jgi:hypothetical protein
MCEPARKLRPRQRQFRHDENQPGTMAAHKKAAHEWAAEKYSRNDFA